MIRTVVGFLIAPIVPAILVAIVGNVPTALVIVIFGYLTVLVLGVPTHMLLRKFALFGRLPYIVAGFVVGALGGTLVGLVMAISDHKPPDSRFMGYAFDALKTPVTDPLPFVFLAFLGGVGALTFWLVARPDLSHTMPATG